MSAPITDAQRDLAVTLTGRHYSISEAAELIADSEAKAVEAQSEASCELLQTYITQRDQLRAEVIAANSRAETWAKMVDDRNAQIATLHEVNADFDKSVAEVADFKANGCSVEESVRLRAEVEQLKKREVVRRPGTDEIVLALVKRAESAEREVERLTALRALELIDKPDQWTPEIEAAHPCETEEYRRYETAMKMVGNRHGKYELVNLVNWLLRCADKAKEERSNNKRVIRALARAERAEAELTAERARLDVLQSRWKAFGLFAETRNGMETLRESIDAFAAIDANMKEDAK